MQSPGPVERDDYTLALPIIRLDSPVTWKDGPKNEDDVELIKTEPKG